MNKDLLIKLRQVVATGLGLGFQLADRPLRSIAVFDEQSTQVHFDLVREPSFGLRLGDKVYLRREPGPDFQQCCRTWYQPPRPDYALPKAYLRVGQELPYIAAFCSVTAPLGRKRGTLIDIFCILASNHIAGSERWELWRADEGNDKPLLFWPGALERVKNA